MMILFILQLVVPLLLVGWFIMRPQRTLVAYGVQLIAFLLLLVATARVGMWLFPPWYTPYAAAITIVVVALFALHGGRFRTTSRASGEVVLTALFLATIAVSGTILIRTVTARNLPDGVQRVALEFPLTGADFLVVNGGNDIMVNAHFASRDTTTTRLRRWRGNAYAIDVVSIDRYGIRARGMLPRDPSKYRIFGMPVASPCPGIVIVAEDGHDDMPVPEYDRENMAGNHVIVRCATADVVLAHFREGSVRVIAGSHVSTGTLLGEVGNSGGTSEPHLHIHAQRQGTRDAPMSGDPLPMTFGGQFLVRNERITR